MGVRGLCGTGRRRGAGWRRAALGLLLPHRGLHHGRLPSLLYEGHQLRYLNARHLGRRREWLRHRLEGVEDRLVLVRAHLETWKSHFQQVDGLPHLAVPIGLHTRIRARRASRAGRAHGVYQWKGGRHLGATSPEPLTSGGRGDCDACESFSILQLGCGGKDERRTPVIPPTGRSPATRKLRLGTIFRQASRCVTACGQL